MAGDDRELVLDALDPAAIADIGRALAALGPSLDRAVATSRVAPVPPCFINPRTTRADVDDLLRSTVAIGDELTS